MPTERSQRRLLLDEVAAKGFRLTSQRKALIQIIQQSRRHVDAATLLELARKRNPRINRATVYRTLELLKKLQLVDELDLMHLAGEKHYYEVRPDRQHIHLACCRCGRIVEFSSETFDRLQSEIAAQTGFEIQVVRLEVGGNCPACAEATYSATSGLEEGKDVLKSSVH
jgi:Fur family ferric uptake transcriptional regulator